MQNQNEKPVLKTIRERYESHKKVGNPAFDLPYSDDYKRLLLSSPDVRAIAQMRENLLHDMGTLLGIADELTEFVTEVMPLSNHFLQLQDELVVKVIEVIG